VTGGTTSSTFNLLPPAETGFVQTLVRGPNGQYAIDQTFGLTAKPVALDVADIDGDGLSDIVSANADPVLPEAGSALPVLSIFRNSGGAFNGSTPFQPEGSSSARSVALIDVDNDGDRDIVSVNNKVGGSEATLLRIDTLGAGTPLAVGQTTVLDASNPIIATRGNLDGVGGEDLFLVNQPSVSNFTGSREVKPFLGVTSLQGDLDGDGQVSTSDIAILLLDFGPERRAHPIWMATARWARVTSPSCCCSSAETTARNLETRIDAQPDPDCRPAAPEPRDVGAARGRARHPFPWRGGGARHVAQRAGPDAHGTTE
jgi:hypothetical protein